MMNHTPSLARLLYPPESHVRLFYDQVFTFGDWAKHRNANWRHRMEPLICARVASGYMWQMAAVLFVSVCVGVYQTWAVPHGAPSLGSQLAVPFSAVTFALSLLLVFKTNSSYGRWWEARIIWGQVVNYARNLPRQLLCYAPPLDTCTPAQRAVVQAALRWTAASVHVMRGHLLETTHQSPEEEAGHLLTDTERGYLRRYWANRPMGVAHVLAWLCAHPVLHMNPQHQAASAFSGLPSPRRTHGTHHDTGWATLVVAPLIAFLLLGTENIGVMIEEPCRVLPLLAICRGIEAGLGDVAAAAQLSLQPIITTHTTPIAPHAPFTTTHDTSANGGGAAAGIGEGAPRASRASGSRSVHSNPTHVLITALGLHHYPELWPVGFNKQESAQDASVVQECRQQGLGTVHRCSVDVGLHTAGSGSVSSSRPSVWLSNALATGDRQTSLRHNGSIELLGREKEDTALTLG